jgi:hypothetical protein
MVLHSPERGNKKNIRMYSAEAGVRAQQEKHLVSPTV